MPQVTCSHPTDCHQAKTNNFYKSLTKQKFKMFLISLSYLPKCPPVCTEWRGVCNRFSWYWEKQNCLPSPSLRDFSDIKRSLPKSCPICFHHGLQVVNIVSTTINTANNSSTNAWSFSSSRRKIINPCGKSHFCASWGSGSSLPSLKGCEDRTGALQVVLLQLFS